MSVRTLRILIIAMVVTGTIALGYIAAAWIADWPTANGWNMTAHQVGLGTTILLVLFGVIFGGLNLRKF